MFCWYTYYDTSGMGDDDCNNLLANNGDVLLSPDQVPLSGMDFAFLNAPAKTTVRQLFIGEAAETLGFIRGKFSGNINMIASPLTMDYNMLIMFGQKEKESAIQALVERLQRMCPWEMMEKNANMVKNYRQYNIV
jgi:hypothetical protein